MTFGCPARGDAEQEPSAKKQRKRLYWVLSPRRSLALSFTAIVIHSHSFFLSSVPFLKSLRDLRAIVPRLVSKHTLQEVLGKGSQELGLWGTGHMGFLLWELGK